MTGDVLARALRQACADLASVGKPFALVGGLAVSLRGYVRFTRDIDFAIVAKDDMEVEELVRTMRTRGYELVTLVEQDETKRIATVRLTSPSGVTLDLLTASSGIEPEVVSRSERLEWDADLSLSVARAEELVSLKVLAMTERRPRDRGDALALLELGVSVSAVEENLQLIESRGYQRKQDLVRKFSELRASIGSR